MDLLLDTTRLLQADGLFGVLMRDIPNPIRLKIEKMLRNNFTGNNSR